MELLCSHVVSSDVLGRLGRTQQLFVVVTATGIDVAAAS